MGKRQTCRDCGKHVWHRTYDCRPVVLDPTPLSRTGEMQAIMAGATTYHIYGTSLIRRHYISLQDAPEPRAGTIHREHRCTDGPVSARQATVSEIPDDCPF